MLDWGGVSAERPVYVYFQWSHAGMQITSRNILLFNYVVLIRLLLENRKWSSRCLHKSNFDLFLRLFQARVCIFCKSVRHTSHDVLQMVMGASFPFVVSEGLQAPQRILSAVLHLRGLFEGGLEKNEDDGICANTE